MRAIGSMIVALAALVSVDATAATEHQPPYWASLGAGQANMRSGPGRNFPTSWVYKRPGLPVRVIEVYPSWRKVIDPDGTQGWMLSNLLSDQRTAIVTAGDHRMRSSPAADASPLWRVAPGVIGKISHCSEGWCQFTVAGHSGYIETAALWGVSRDEVVK